MKRRSFIAKTSLSSAALFSSIHIPSFSQDRTISIGLIGCGWYGMVITKAALKAGGVKVIGICDIDTDHLSKSAEELEQLQGTRPKEFKEYQDLLKMKKLDAVFIGTPPHWHALQFVAASKKGLPIYCEKPLAYDIKEGMAMVKAAEDAGNIVQVGFQRRKSNAFRKAKEMIESGKAGKIRAIDAQIHYNPNPGDISVQEPPASLDWDAWCGPAPKLDYRPSIGHISWRLEKEYGNGHLVDWGIHHIDIIRKTMNFGMPSKISTAGSLDVLKGTITTPDTLEAKMQFGDIPLTWRHRLWGPGELDRRYNNGVFFFGEKATIFASDRLVELKPNGKDAELQVEEIPTKDMQEQHVADFVNAVKMNDKSKITCTVQDAFQSTSTVQLAMISYYTGSTVGWDAGNMTLDGSDEAQKLLARSYRKGFSRPS